MKMEAVRSSGTFVAKYKTTDVTTLKTVIDIFRAMRTSNLTET
jgi:hypothetical protein